MQLPISSLVLGLLPLASAGPIAGSASNPRSDSTSCTQATIYGFDWTIEGFDYQASYVFSNPAHEIASGVVKFNLSNPALPYLASCTAMSTQLEDFFYGNEWYSCTLPSGETNGAAVFEFNYAAGSVSVNQTWECPGEDPTTYTASGLAYLPLNCTDESWQNPNWTEEETYSTRLVSCQSPDGEMIPYQLLAAA